VLCVAFANATHFGATRVYVGGSNGASTRKLAAALLGAYGNARGETWRARPC